MHFAGAQKKHFLALLILSVLGMLVTIYATYQHYKPAGGSFCNINDYVNCDIVNKSIYSEIFGISVAIFGFLAYFYFFIVSLGFIKEWHFKKIILNFTAFFGAFSLLFSLYLTYIEFFILRALCILCIAQQIFILLIFIVYIALWYKNRKLSLSP